MKFASSAQHDILSALGKAGRGGVRKVARGAFLILAMAALSGCEALSNGNFFDSLFSRSQPRDSTRQTEQGLGKLAKGDLVQSAQLFDDALRRNPEDVHALLGRAMIFQNTGQLTQARLAYEAVLARRPGPQQRMLVINNLRPRALSEIASVNLDLLKSRNVTGSLRPPQSVVAPAGPVGPTFGQGPGRLAAPGLPGAAGAARPFATPRPAATPAARIAANANVVSRFETLRTLRDSGLITPQEYQVRRQVNAGALLPLTKPPPATGLDRPVPSAAQITSRLKAIGRALELRAITPSQHSAERTMIVDGLLPARPTQKANPAPPPQGLMEAAAEVGRIEQLKQKRIITDDEYAKERAAIEGTLRPKAAPPSAASPGAAPAPLASGPQPGVHLASFKSRAAATRGWTQLRRAHRQLLSSLKHEVSRVNLGRGKGVFFRLMAGPLANQAAAAALCTRLKARRQYCEPAFVGGG